MRIEMRLLRAAGIGIARQSSDPSGASEQPLDRSLAGARSPGQLGERPTIAGIGKQIPARQSVVPTSYCTNFDSSRT
jgi:hypothetical protein